MKLEQQVCSLELAQKLKKLGTKQESLWCWQLNKNSWILVLMESIIEENDCCSAFTTSELGEMLPSVIKQKSAWVDIDYFYYELEIIKNKKGKWLVWYNHNEEQNNHRTGRRKTKWFSTNETLAGAMAKMLIYLLENNLL